MSTLDILFFGGFEQSESIDGNNRKPQLGPTWFKPRSQDFTVGRDESIIETGNARPYGVGALIDRFLPAGHAFGARHDRFVGRVQDALNRYLPNLGVLRLPVENLVFNYPSMLVMYPLSVAQELFNTPVGIFNVFFQSHAYVPFEKE